MNKSNFNFRDEESQKNYDFVMDVKNILPPLLIIDGPSGCGKTTLANMLLSLRFSNRIWHGFLPENESDWMKQASLLLRHDCVFFDYVWGKVMSPTFQYILNNDHWSGRVLGKSVIETFSYSTRFVIATSKCSFSPEIERRSRRINLKNPMNLWQ